MLRANTASRRRSGQVADARSGRVHRRNRRRFRSSFPHNSWPARPNDSRNCFIPSNSTKTKRVATKKRFKITPEIREAYENRNRALDADPDSRPLPPEKWVNAMTRAEFEDFLAAKHSPKKLTTVRLDADVLDWLKSKGEGHISRVNSILRAVMLAEQKR